MLSAEHSAKSETIEITLNKEHQTFSGKPFGDMSAFPVTISDPISGKKATVDFDEEEVCFLLDIDGEPFESLVFLDSTFSLEDDKTKACDFKISLNDKAVNDSGFEWQPHVLQHAIYAALDDDEPITSIKIENIKDTSAATMNEAISLLLL